MRLHQLNINSLLLSLLLSLSSAPIFAEPITTAEPPATAAALSTTTSQAADQISPTLATTQTDERKQLNEPSRTDELTAKTAAITDAAPKNTPEQTSTSTLPLATPQEPKSELLPAPQNEPPASSTASTAKPEPATIDSSTAPTSLAAPLNAENARKFSGQSDSPVAIDLHPPGHFSTAEPLNPSAENLLKPDPAAPPPAPLAPAAPFTLLNVTLNPGSASRMAWSPEDSFSGIATPTPVLVVHGAKPGPKICLTAAVHGDEVNGIEVVRHILYDLDPNQLAGTVIGVPIVNMQGFRRNSRYLADRRDLNRFFPGHSQGSAASRIAASLFNEVIMPCQYLIDIHTGSMSRTNLPQLRADLTKPKVAELANLLGDIAVLQNKGAKGSLRRAAMDKGIAAVVIEAGEPYTFQESAIDKSLHAIKTLLSQLKMYPYSPSTTEALTPKYYTSQWLRAKAGGMLFSRVSLGQAVKSGDLLGVITDPITNQSNLLYSPKDAVILGMALNQVLHPGFAAYHLGIAANLSEVQQSDSGPEDFGSDSAQADNQDIR